MRPRNGSRTWQALSAPIFPRAEHHTSLCIFLLVIAFTFFYVNITFNPEQVAENIQKRGGYIPGIRPGKQTSEYLQKISDRLNLFGGLFIGFIAILPMILQNVSSSFSFGSVPTIISGAG